MLHYNILIMSEGPPGSPAGSSSPDAARAFRIIIIMIMIINYS